MTNMKHYMKLLNIEKFNPFQLLIFRGSYSFADITIIELESILSYFQDQCPWIIRKIN